MASTEHSSGASEPSPPAADTTISVSAMQPHPTSSSTRSGPSSHFFHPYRTIGHITSPFPFHFSSLGSARFITVPVGRRFTVYNLDRLRVVMLSEPVPCSSPIVALTALSRDVTACAAGRAVYLYKRGERMCALEPAAAEEGQAAEDGSSSSSDGGGDVYLVKEWGKQFMLTVDEGQLLRLWDLSTVRLHRQREYGEWEAAIKKEKAEEDDDDERKDSMHTEHDTVDDIFARDGDEQQQSASSACVASISLRRFDFPAAVTAASPSSPSFLHLPSTSRLTCLLHPPTFVNKVLLAFNTGLLLLYNLHTRSAIHAYYPIQDFIAASMPSASSSSAPSPLAPSPPPSAASHASSSITALAASPSPGIVSVSTSSGLILQYSIDTATVISAFVSHHGAVTSLSYRTDGLPQLLSGTASGHLLCWHLGDWEEAAQQWRRRPGFLCVVQWCHEGGVLEAMWLPHEPLVCSSGKDNALCVLSAEGEGGRLRLLKRRSGHRRGARVVRWMGREEMSKSSDVRLLTAGDEGALRLWSLRRDEDSRELGRRKVAPVSRRQLMIDADSEDVEEELRPVEAVAFSLAPSASRFSNVLTAHTADAAARMWSTDSSSLSALSLLNPLLAFSAVRSVEVSACGQWGVVGKANGSVDMFAMESGIYRGSFGAAAAGGGQTGRRRRKGQLHTLDDLLKPEDIQFWGVKKRKEEKEETKAEEKEEQAAAGREDGHGSNGKESVAAVEGGHTAAVTGVQLDGMNRWLVTASLDGSVKLWQVSSRSLCHTLRIGSPVSRLLYHRDNDLFAIATDDHQLLVYDNSSSSASSPPALIRSFRAHTQPVTDLAFSPRGHLLLSASLSCLLLVHHLPSSLLLDVLHFSSPVLSLAFSPLGDLVATSHVGTVGVQLWLSKDWVGAGWDAMRRDGEGTGEEVEMLEADDEEQQPQTAGGSTAVADGSGGSEEELSRSREAQRLSGLITFSSLPRNRWHALLHWDEIKHRNRAREQDVTRNEAAPFFLSTLHPSRHEPPPADSSQTQTEQQHSKRARGRIIRSKGVLPDPPIIPLLQTAADLLDSSPSSSPQSLYDAYLPATSHLLSLTPAELDSLILSLSPHPSQRRYFMLLLRFFVSVLPAFAHYEFMQSVMLRMLRAHGQQMMEEGEEVQQLVRALAVEQRKGWQRLETQLLRNAALVNHLARIT